MWVTWTGPGLAVTKIHLSSAPCYLPKAFLFTLYSVLCTYWPRLYFVHFVQPRPAQTASLPYRVKIQYAAELSIGDTVPCRVNADQACPSLTGLAPAGWLLLLTPDDTTLTLMTKLPIRPYNVNNTTESIANLTLSSPTQHLIPWFHHP